MFTTAITTTALAMAFTAVSGFILRKDFGRYQFNTSEASKAKQEGNGI